MLERLLPVSLAGAFFLAPAVGAGAAEVTLTRLDCGTGFNDARRFSDTFAYTDPKVPFTFSCYVIKHGDDYMVWDTGYLPGSNPNAPKVEPLADQLAQIKIKPEQVKYVGISHFHADHTGQLAPLPNATLLIGKGDWDAHHRAEADGGRQRRRLQALDQRRRQGRAAGRGQGRVRRRQRR